MRKPNAFGCNRFSKHAHESNSRMQLIIHTIVQVGRREGNGLIKKSNSCNRVGPTVTRRPAVQALSLDRSAVMHEQVTPKTHWRAQTSKQTSQADLHDSSRRISLRPQWRWQQAGGEGEHWNECY